MPTRPAGDRHIEIPENFEDPGLPHHHTFSPSQFSTYKTCPKRYFYRYVMNWKKAPGIAMVQGSTIHKGAEKTHQHTIDTGTPLGLEEAKSVVADDFEYRKQEVEDWQDHKPDHIKQKVIDHFTVYYQTAVPVIRPKKVEQEFAIKFGTVPLVGFIDLVDQVYIDSAEMPHNKESDVPLVAEVVSDLKFTGRQWSEQKLKYDAQLTFYAHVEGTPRVRVDFLLDQKSGTRYVPKKSLRNPHDVKMLIEDVEETVDLIKKGIFPRALPTEWMCNPKWCGYYEKCRGPK